MVRPAALLLMLATAPALSGCIAAAAPVLAGGMIARATVLKDKPATGGVAAPAAAPAPSATPAAHGPSVAAMPTDPAQAVPGQFYAGTLPAPTVGTADRPAPGPAGDAPPPVSASPDERGWPALVRFVARNKSAPGHSALLVRGGALADPKWVGCAGKPPAVLAPVSVLLSGAGKTGQVAERDLGWIVALPLMGTALVMVADGPAEATAARAALARANMAQPIAGDTLVTVNSEAELPAARAAVGARYCVIALAGHRAADFPHALLPASTPPALAGQWNAGWFWFGPNAG